MKKIIIFMTMLLYLGILLLFKNKLFKNYSFCSEKIEDFLNDNPSMENRDKKSIIRRISSFKAETLQSYKKNYNK